MLLGEEERTVSSDKRKRRVESGGTSKRFSFADAGIQKKVNKTDR